LGGRTSLVVPITGQDMVTVWYAFDGFTKLEKKAMRGISSRKWCMLATYQARNSSCCTCLAAFDQPRIDRDHDANPVVSFIISSVIGREPSSKLHPVSPVDLFSYCSQSSPTDLWPNVASVTSINEMREIFLARYPITLTQPSRPQDRPRDASQYHMMLSQEIFMGKELMWKYCL
jgi:hypothetical protein